MPQKSRLKIRDKYYIMANMKKRFVLIFLILILLGGLAVVYINRILLPVKVKALIVQKAQEYLHRKIHLGSIHFNLIKGFTIKDLTIFDKDSETTPFIHLDEATFSILYTPIIKNKNIIIPSLRIHNPSIGLTRIKEDTWNFSDMVPSQKDENVPKNPFSFYFGHIVVSNGKISFSDLSLVSPLSEVVENLNMEVSYSLTGIIHCNLEAEAPLSGSSLALKGDYTIANKKITAQINAANILLEKYVPVYLKNPFVELKKGELKTLSANLTHLDKEIELEGSLEFKDADLILASGQEIRGHFKTFHSAFSSKDNLIRLTGDLEATDASWQLDEQHHILGQLKVNLLTLKQKNNKLELESDVSLQQAQLQWGPDILLSADLKTSRTSFLMIEQTLQVNTDVNLDIRQGQFGEDKDFKGTLTMPKLVLDAQAGNITVAGDMDIRSGDVQFGETQGFKGDMKTTDTKLVLQGKKFTFESKAVLDNSIVKIGSTGIQGNPSFNLNLSYDPAQEIPLNYEGTFDPRLMILTGLPYIGEAKDIQGEIEFETDKIHFPRLSAVILDASIELSGEMSQLINPYLEIKAQIKQVDPGKLVPLIPDLFAKAQISEATGPIDIDLDFKGNALAPLEAEATMYAKLDHVTIASPKLPEQIKDITGIIKYSKDHLEWQNLTGMFQNKIYSISGNLENFSKPVVKTSLAADDLELNAHINILNNAIQIITLNGKYLHSDFGIKGDVHYNPDTDFDLDLSAEVNFDLKDAMALAPRFKDRLDQLDPAGNFFMSGILKGTLKDWRHWVLVFTATSPAVSLLNYTIEDVFLKYEQRDENINQCDLQAFIYDGVLKLTSTTDLRSEGMPFRLTAQLENTDLRKVIEDSKFRKQDISGNFSSYLTLRGFLSDIKKMEGHGQIRIRDGRLWELDLFKGLGKLLLIPEYHDIVFTAASTDFTVGHERILTDNLEIISQPVTLKGKGSIDFAGNINFDIGSEFNTRTIEESDSIKKTMTAILTQTNDYLTIKISGTLKEPKYAVTTTPVNVIEKTRDLIKEGLESIF